MRVLVTGGMGLVGRSVVGELLNEGHSVRLFDTADRGRARRLIATVEGAMRSVVRNALGNRNALEFRRGDLCNIADVGEAVRDVDAVIHLGALIPPAADQNPRYASYVNTGGTENLIRALAQHAPGARFIYTSSIAVYGDRRGTREIRSSDSPNPGADDHYAHQKLAAEKAVRASTLDWVILRLTYIVSPEKLKTDPLMFHMPLDTCIEVCGAGDTARSLVHAVSTPEAARRIFDIAGGPRCRTTFRDYLTRMLTLFGIDAPLPDIAFSTGPFHCGYVDTRESQAVLDYQRETLEDYYARVSRKVAFRRLLLRAMPVVRRLVHRLLVRSSPFAPRGVAPRGARGLRMGGGARLGLFIRRMVQIIFGFPLRQ